MERRRRRTQTHVLMRNIVIASSVISSVVNLTILAISASAGKLDDDLFCVRVLRDKDFYIPTNVWERPVHVHVYRK